jgi:hypothetical protein
MASPDYYREQARLLMRWGALARDPAVVEKLTDRAQDLLDMAHRQETGSGALLVNWVEVRKRSNSS